MPKLFEFSHEIDKNERKTDIEMSKEHRELLAEDKDYTKYMIEYRRDSGWDHKAKRGQIIYNVLQTMEPEDEISRIFIGYSRMIIDKGIEQMTEGEPDFSFEPRGPSDHMKTIIWKHLVQMLLNDSDYRLHQETFFRDYFVMGSGVFEVYIDYPQRTLRIPIADGKFDSVLVADHRRPQVGIRAVNPMNCWRNPNIDTPSDVPSCLKRRVISWNQFAQEFGRCFIGEQPKYMNLDKIAQGSHVALYTLQDEIRDVYRVYARSYGQERDGSEKTTTLPPEGDLGILIFDTSLKIHEQVQDKIVIRSTGMNIPGLCSLRWGTNYDKYDRNYTGDHSVYGMGLPERIEGEDTVLQTMFNMNIDNYRMSQSVALNYKGNNADSYIDVDANRLYGGEFIDGEITPMPLGIARQGEFQALQESIDRTVIPSTAINHQQMVGDTSKTAFEFAQRIRMANRGAEQRLKRLENEVFKPVGELMLANALTTLTVENFEDMTEKEVETARVQIKNGKRTTKDFENLNSKSKEKKPRKRVITYIPLKGEKIREDFTITKTRQLDYNAEFTKEGNSTNTLRKDDSMPVETSYIPLVEEYVYPADYIEQLPDAVVDSKRMLGDQKAQDVENFQAATNFLLEFIQVTGYDKLDPDKIVQETLRFANITEDRMLKTSEGQSKMGQMTKSIIDQFEKEQTQQIEGKAPSPLGGAIEQPEQQQPSALEQLVQ